jgi:predicted permease
MLRGRPFDERDRAGASPVVIVNQSFARRFWGDADPIGRRITTKGVTWEVIGVVRDAKYVSLSEEPQPHHYLPWAQAYAPDMVLQVRTAGDSRTLLPTLAALVRDLDPELPVEPITIEQHLGYALLPQRLGAIVLGAFGAVGMALAALGLYGVMSYVVSQRTAEIGIRMALGATARDVRRLVVRRGMGLTAVGLGIGLAGALAAGRLIAGYLFGIRAADPLILAAVVALFGGVAFAASWIPAYRAARVDPMRALRAE